MRRLLTVLLLIAGTLWPLTAFAVVPVTQIHNPAGLTAIFENAGVNATFVLYEPYANKLTIYNDARAQQRFVPASTFKIVNTLIGLGSGAVTSLDDEIFYWDTEAPRNRPEWEKDMNLREAARVSCLPVYRELARRIGFERMRAAVTEMGYGNAEIGKPQNLETFWLNGPLAINAVEQAVFMTRLSRNDLPMPMAMQQQAAEIFLQESNTNGALYAKSGAAVKAYGVPLGWWVGWVVKGDAVYGFALNMDMPDYDNDLPKREVLARACLKALGVW